MFTEYIQNVQLNLKNTTHKQKMSLKIVNVLKINMFSEFRFFFSLFVYIMINHKYQPSIVYVSNHNLSVSSHP